MMYYSLPGEDSNKLAPSMHPAISMIMTCDLYISDIPKLKLCTCCILFLASYSRRFDNIHVAAAANFRIAALATTSTWTIVQQLQAIPSSNLICSEKKYGINSSPRYWSKFTVMFKRIWLFLDFQKEFHIYPLNLSSH